MRLFDIFKRGNKVQLEIAENLIESFLLNENYKLKAKVERREREIEKLSETRGLIIEELKELKTKYSEVLGCLRKDSDDKIIAKADRSFTSKYTKIVDGKTGFFVEYKNYGSTQASRVTKGFYDKVVPSNPPHNNGKGASPTEAPTIKGNGND